MADQAIPVGSDTWKRMKAAADAETGALEAEKKKKDYQKAGVSEAQHAADVMEAQDPGGVKRGVWNMVEKVLPAPPPNPAAAAEAQKAQMQNSLTSQARAMATHQALQSGKLQWGDLPRQLQQDLINSPDLGHMYQGIPE